MANIRAEFLLDRQGKTVATLAGLLDAAHSEGLSAIDTQLIQIGSEENSQTWLFRAQVTTSKGTFSGFGDANPANVSRQMLTVLPRMAESRAIARALRWAVNSTVAAAEEFDDDEPTHAPAQPSPPVPKPVNTSASQATPQVPRPQPPTGVAPPIQNGPLATEKQRNAIYAIAERIGLDKATIEEMCEQQFGSKPSGLSTKQASEIIGKLQTQQQGAG